MSVFPATPRLRHFLPALLPWLLAVAHAGEALAGSQGAAATRTPAQTYRAACASCHGADGRGAAASAVGFDVPIPDFSDCSFATREPDADWWAIAHQGGPTRAFDRMMPAFGAALTEAELDAALEHVRSFCPERAWPRGELNLPRTLFTEKAYPEDEAVLTTAVATEGTGAVASKFVYEHRVGARNQIEVVVPFGVREGTEGSWTSGLGDVAVGFKSAFFHSHASGTILALTGEFVLPTGDTAKGFGKDVVIFEPFLSFGQILPADAFVQFQGGAELPFDTDKAGNEAFWRVAVGKSFVQNRFGRTWSPMVELLAARELESGAPTDWDVVPQMQVTLSTRQHIMANLGVRVPLNDAAERSTQVAAYLLWDWFDGGLFDGW